MSLSFATKRYNVDPQRAFDITPVLKDGQFVKVMINVFRDHKYQYMLIVPINVFEGWISDDPSHILKQIETYHELKQFSR